ncbi:carboxypeptidase C prc1, partial [Saguinus oedipus]
EVLAEESIVCLQKALNHLREIWELIGIPEDQRLQRTEVVKKHIKELLDMMIAEEESLKERLIKSISVCQKELNTLCSELRVEPFQKMKTGSKSYDKKEYYPKQALWVLSYPEAAYTEPTKIATSEEMSQKLEYQECKVQFRTRPDIYWWMELRGGYIVGHCKSDLSEDTSKDEMKHGEEGETTILQLEKDLRTQVELMRKQKKERKQELKLLQEQDQELCEILCTPHYDIDSASVPSLEELNQFRQHVATLRETKASRYEEFVSIKRQIILCMEELDHTPDTSFERDVVCEDEDAFCLSLENIATLQKLLRQLEMQKSQNEAVCEGLRAQIRELWDRLQIPEEEREAVATIMSGSKAKVRKALQLEVDRLEELKMQNLKKVIEAIRVELAQYWDQCFYSQEQREAFAPFHAEDYTENLLQLHDAEIVRLRNYYEAHRELFEG